MGMFKSFPLGTGWELIGESLTSRIKIGAESAQCFQEDQKVFRGFSELPAAHHFYWVGISVIPDVSATDEELQILRGSFFEFRYGYKQEKPFMSLSTRMLLGSYDADPEDADPVFMVTPAGRPLEIIALEQWSCFFVVPGAVEAPRKVSARLVLHGALAHLIGDPRKVVIDFPGKS